LRGPELEDAKYCQRKSKLETSLASLPIARDY